MVCFTYFTIPSRLQLTPVAARAFTVANTPRTRSYQLRAHSWADVLAPNAAGAALLFYRTVYARRFWTLPPIHIFVDVHLRAFSRPFADTLRCYISITVTLCTRCRDVVVYLLYLHQHSHGTHIRRLL